MKNFKNTRQHLGHLQPPETIGKIITYRSEDSNWHIPVPADEVVWSGQATIGRVYEYVVIK